MASAIIPVDLGLTVHTETQEVQPGTNTFDYTPPDGSAVVSFGYDLTAAGQVRVTKAAVHIAGGQWVFEAVVESSEDFPKNVVWAFVQVKP
jgi:hypothetical protein